MKSPLITLCHKLQATSYKLHMRHVACGMWLTALSTMFVVSFLTVFSVASYAQDIMLLYTGETHAMLYPCNCPKEPDGGVARRATKVTQLRESFPDALLLDSGSFFAGGLMDENTLNSELDMQRSRLNLKAMEYMKYDAVSIGDDEFNFGTNFLKQEMSQVRLAFLSCNADIKGALPYIIKENKGIKIGILGVTVLSAAQKAAGSTVSDPLAAIQKSVKEARKQGAQIIVLLSNLDEKKDEKIIKALKGIDVLVVTHNDTGKEPFSYLGNTLLLRPNWQGRRLSKALLRVENGKVAGHKVTEERLMDKLSDDPGVLTFLPRCFSDAQCKKEGQEGTCKNPGSMSAQCHFNAASKIPLLVINTPECATCSTGRMIDFLKKQYLGLEVTTLSYPDSAQAHILLKDLDITALPAYLLGKEVAQEKNFEQVKANLEQKGDFYMVKPRVSGLTYFFKREKIKDRLDVFLSVYDKDTVELLEVVRDLKPEVHFLAVEQEKVFDALNGNLEVEECLRAVCVQKYFRAKFFEYLRCRAKNSNSSWWETCLDEAKVKRIARCARSDEAKELLRENIHLNAQLGIMAGPTYLLENKELFSSKRTPSKEELEKIIKR